MRVAVGVFGALGCIGGLVGLKKRLQSLLRPTTIEIDPGQVVYSRQVGSAMGHDQWSRKWIAALGTRAAGLNETLRREWQLELWLTTGQAYLLYTGPDRPVTTLATAISESLSIPYFPRKVGVTRQLTQRLRRIDYPTSVEFTFAQPLVPLLAWALLPVALAVAVAGEIFVFRPSRTPSWVPTHAVGWTVARVAGFTVALWVAAIEFLRRARRRKFLSLVAGQLIVTEIAPVDPLRRSWPIDSIAGFELSPRGGTNASLLARTKDGAVNALLADEPGEDLRALATALEELLSRRAAPPAVAAPAIAQIPD